MRKQHVTSLAIYFLVDGEVVGSIGKGLCILVGIDANDNSEDSSYIINKILKMRLFSDEAGDSWKRNVVEVEGEILLASQFTIMAQTDKGTKPDFRKAMSADQARGMFHEIVQQLKTRYSPLKVQSKI